jgi:hypothetical protein
MQQDKSKFPTKARRNRSASGETARHGSWQFRSQDEVGRFWLNVRKVPRRTEGRTHKQYERYYLGLYLLALADHRLLKFPLEVREGDSPDFVFVHKSAEAVGLEVTRATDEGIQAAISHEERAHPGGSAMIVSPHGYAGDELERQWCVFIRKAVEKKAAMLTGYRPAARYDLLVSDDTRMGAGDRRKVLAMLDPWARNLKQQQPRLGKISVAASLDILYDVGGQSRIFPFIAWSVPGAQTGTQTNFSDRVEYAGWLLSGDAIQAHQSAGVPIYFVDNRGKLVKRTAGGRQFEVRIDESGEEITLRELPRR